MAKLYFYGAGRAIQEAMCSAVSTSTHPYSTSTYYDVNGTAIDNVTVSTGSAALPYARRNFHIFAGWTGYLSARSSFDISDYTEGSIADITYLSRTETPSTIGNSYVITAKNNGASAVTVNSIMFTKELGIYSGTNTTAICLIAGYFLDNPVTLEAGETKTFSVVLDCWNY